MTNRLWSLGATRELLQAEIDLLAEEVRKVPFPRAFVRPACTSPALRPPLCTQKKNYGKPGCTKLKGPARYTALAARVMASPLGAEFPAPLTGEQVNNRLQRVRKQYAVRSRHFSAPQR